MDAIERVEILRALRKGEFDVLVGIDFLRKRPTPKGLEGPAHRLDARSSVRHCSAVMKTVSTQQVIEQFDQYSQLAHDGQRILVTRGGKPWVLLAPPAVGSEAEPARSKLVWPDFAGRLAKHYPVPATGPTATELLAEDKEDRF